ncbi:MAG: hypothetical protein IT432_06190 [Phycisphaerales bacterium]|nr:hypothetical protein [Phycisphaerales bacterium]
MDHTRSSLTTSAHSPDVMPRRPSAGMPRHAARRWLLFLIATLVVMLAPPRRAPAQPVATPAEDTTQPGLLAFWSAGVSHATNLGQVDWSKYTNVTVETQVNWPNTNAEFYSGGPTDYFALQLIGRIDIPADGTWTFGVSSDAGARLFIDGHLVVNDDANHAFRRQAGSITLTAGRHTIEVRYLEIYYAQGLVLDWSGPGINSATTIPASAFRHDPAEAGVTDPGHGLRAYWSNAVSHATKLGEVDWTTYDTTTVETSVSWPITNTAFYAGGPTDYFALKLKANIEIPEAGSWTFKLGSDAGARLFIDGRLVINDDANHSFRFQSGTISLSAGTHTFEVRYLEIYYSQGLVCTWKAPSASYEEVIPSSAFTPATVEPPGDTGNGLNAYWSNAVSHATTLGQVDWTKYDTATTVAKVSWPITNSAFYSGGPTDYFAVRLMGEITIPSTGTWTFKLGSDAGARLIIDGSTVVNDDANHSFRFTQGTVALAAGVHTFEVRYLDIYYSQGLICTWQAPGAPYEEVIPASAFDPLAYVPGADGQGLRAYWSSGTSHATKLGEVDWSTYDTVTTESRVSWNITNSAFYSGGPTDYFALRLVGKIKIPAAGGWTFKIGSDAGARLFINDQLVVNDDANHSFRFTSGAITLPAGEVRIEIRYLEIYYSQGLVLTWQGPGTAEEVVPASAFLPDPDEPPADVGGGSLRAYWSSGTSHATRLGEVDWLAYDTTSTVPKINWRITNNAFSTGGPTDYFAARFVGEIDIPTTGQWIFKLGSDAGARLLIDGELVVNDDANHSFRFISGQKILTAGKHRFEVRYLEIYYSQGLFVTWQAPGSPYEEVIPSSAFTSLPLESPGGNAAGRGGLAATWVNHNTSFLDGVNWAAPSATTNQVDNIAWRLTNNAFYTSGPTNYFAAKFSGIINIPETGTWIFKLGSDAGARLVIDGIPVINDDANHSFRFTPGSVELTAGKHRVEVRYMEIYYSQGLVLTWQAPSAPYEEVVPATAFGSNGKAVRVVRWRERSLEQDE